MNKETIAGITYSKPTVILLQETGIGTAEYAARTCYDSFDSSNNEAIPMLNIAVTEGQSYPEEIKSWTPILNKTNHSDLLDKLAWTHFHHSILEHANLTYLIKGTSRGVLQEHARHRIQAISVRSTRYTMQDILHAFNVCSIAPYEHTKRTFHQLIQSMDMFIVQGLAETTEINALYDKLHHQLVTIGSDEFTTLTMSKSAQEVYANRDKFESPTELFYALQDCKAKRNVGDPLKWCVTDNWKVDMVVTFNLRSLKNYFQLRDSGSAYFQIRWLAQAMKEVTPSKYLDLIVK
ncbi:MAG: FAD-dependent thymidylate synthase [Nanoarchaeota archaeon]|nr:FAD-dependent thymidylate synthase [Nanoarchaeota archaeon]